VKYRRILINVNLLDIVCPTFTLGTTVYFYQQLYINPIMLFSDFAVLLFLCVSVKFLSSAAMTPTCYIRHHCNAWQINARIFLTKACLGVSELFTS
jgi:hypothetical protein